ncbi:hypothetical protein Q9L58_010616 [Maublancomyces gigas]|uniref:Uncharacterized protein n=1 Tax=Discina gigas TaxID=1032678 RepID=A0ABR3G476_9PEZI
MNTEKGIRRYLEATGTHVKSPADIINLQIAFAAASPLASDLPEWAWREYQIIADNYSRMICLGSRSFEPVNAFQMVQGDRTCGDRKPTKEYDKDKQSYTDATKYSMHTGFTKVRNKINPALCFTPEYNRIMREVIVQTNGPLSEFIIDDNILNNINKETPAQGLQFLSSCRCPSGNLVLQTKPTSFANQGAELATEIAAA